MLKPFQGDLGRLIDFKPPIGWAGKHFKCIACNGLGFLRKRNFDLGKHEKSSLQEIFELTPFMGI
jgi:hypothetical protein